MGEPAYDKRVIGHVIKKITLSSMSNPEKGNGKTYEENLELCAKMCIDSKECNGIEVYMPTKPPPYTENQPTPTFTPTTLLPHLNPQKTLLSPPSLVELTPYALPLT